MYEKAYYRIILINILLSIVIWIIVSSVNLRMNNDILLSLLIGCIAFEIMNKNNKEEKENISITNNNHTNITKKSIC